MIAQFFKLNPVNKAICVPTQQKHQKINKKKFGCIKKRPYLCHRYPENNLFTLKGTNTY